MAYFATSLCLIRDLVEVYVDDIIVKVKSSASLLDNLAQVFDKLRLTHTKLNPDKYMFGVTAGKLLGFLVLCRGIEANPKKIRIIEPMRPPARIKDVQKLTGCLATLSRFISGLAEQTHPFFKLLRKSGPFIWTKDVEETFQELKRYLTSPPVMVAPEPDEPRLLYIAATSEAMSMVLVVRRPNPRPAQDPRPAEEPRAVTVAGSQSPEAAPGPPDQAITGSRAPELPPGVKGRELPGPAPMEMDASDPSGRVQTVQRLVYYISEVLH
jgi:hypothetical protein